MKVQSIVFVLFLVISSFLSTRSWAQTYSLQPKNELEASQDAYWLGEEMQRNQPAISDVQKAENHSRNAMHWTAVTTGQWAVANVNGQSQVSAAVSKQPVNTQKVTPSSMSISKHMDKPVKTMGKPAKRSL